MTKNSKKSAGLSLRFSKIVKRKPVKKIVSKTSKKRAISAKKSRVSRPLLSVGRLETSSKKIAIAKKMDKSVNINVADNPLDVYQSPHLLDLSQFQFIERVSPAPAGESFSYDNLPGGDILEKLYIFDLLSFEKSEIISGFRSFINGLSSIIRKPFRKVIFSAKLPLVKNDDSFLTDHLSFWQEVTLINLISSIISGLSGLGQNVHTLASYFKQSWRAKLADDEVVHFELRQIGDDADNSDNLSHKEFSSEIKPPDSEFRPSETIFVSPIFRFLAWPDMRSRSFKGVIAFAVVAILIALPIKAINYWQEVNLARGQVLGEAEQALQNLQSAQSQLFGFDLNQAENSFSTASQHFVSAQNQLNQIKSFLTVLAENVPINNEFRSGKNLLELGGHLSLAGENLLKGVGYLTSTSTEDQGLTDKIKSFQGQSSVALNELKLAQDNLKKIDLNQLPAENRGSFTLLEEKLPVFISSLEKSDEVVNFAVNFLGDQDLKRYLVVFQNDNELRATGGFMGSFALVDLEMGKIKNITMPAGGTYDVRAGFNELLKPPEPMQLVTPRWEFQDSNWWPDWPTSAQSMAWFYQKSKGPTIDGVIAINSDWLSSLLGVVGPIDLPEYKKTITAANFENEIQQEVEINHQDDKTPKKILADLAPKLLDKIFNVQPENALDLISAVSKGLNQKDILVYLFDPQSENFMVQNNWDGRLKNSDFDYLSVVATNIGGGKTDNVVKQKIYHKAEILADGSVIDSVLISRYHFGPIDENFTTVANRSYLRIYAPQGSQLIKATGFVQPLATEFRTVEDYLKPDERLAAENNAVIDPISKTKTYNESGKTVFANWLSINPGESKDILLVYKLPGKINFKPETNNNSFINKIKAAFSENPPDKRYGSYELLVQKQPGGGDDEIVSEVVYPNELELWSNYPQPAESSPNKVIFSGKLTGDQYYLSDFRY